MKRKQEKGTHTSNNNKHGYMNRYGNEMNPINNKIVSVCVCLFVNR